MGSEVEAKRDQIEKQWRSALASEQLLSAAYVRLRGMLNAWGTPERPSPEQIYAHTEERLAAVIRERDEAVETARSRMLAVNALVSERDAARAERERAVAEERERCVALLDYWDWLPKADAWERIYRAVESGRTDEQFRRELEKW